MLAEVSEKIHTVSSFLLDFWWVFIAGLAGFLARFIGKRVAKSYTNEIDELKKDVQDIKKDVSAMKDRNFLPKHEAEGIIKEVKHEHKDLVKEQRESFKRIDSRLDDLYEILLQKRS